MAKDLGTLLFKGLPFTVGLTPRDTDCLVRLPSGKRGVLGALTFGTGMPGCPVMVVPCPVHGSVDDLDSDFLSRLHTQGVPALPGVVNFNGLKSRPLWFCQHKQEFFHPTCPECGLSLNGAGQDSLLCTRCGPVAADAQLIDSFARTGDTPCIQCDERANCHASPSKAVTRIVPLVTDDFRFCAFAYPPTHLLDFAVQLRSRTRTTREVMETKSKIVDRISRYASAWASHDELDISKISVETVRITDAVPHPEIILIPQWLRRVPEVLGGQSGYEIPVKVSIFSIDPIADSDAVLVKLRMKKTGQQSNLDFAVGDRAALRFGKTEGFTTPQEFGVLVIEQNSEQVIFNLEKTLTDGKQVIHFKTLRFLPSLELTLIVSNAQPVSAPKPNDFRALGELLLAFLVDSTQASGEHLRSTISNLRHTVQDETELARMSLNEDSRCSAWFVFGGSNVHESVRSQWREIVSTALALACFGSPETLAHLAEQAKNFSWVDMPISPAVASSMNASVAEAEVAAVLQELISDSSWVARILAATNNADMVPKIEYKPVPDTTSRSTSVESVIMPNPVLPPVMPIADLDATIIVPRSQVAPAQAPTAAHPVEDLDATVIIGREQTPAVAPRRPVVMEHEFASDASGDDLEATVIIPKGTRPELKR